MTPRQCEIAAESYAASLLAQSGFDVLVQYGANQPHYDLVAERDGRFFPISVKGSQDGGWMLAVKYLRDGFSYHDAIDAWQAAQRNDLIFLFVQFHGVEPGQTPRVYVAKPNEIAEQLKTQRNGVGEGSLRENSRAQRPRSKYDDKIPDHWAFSEKRFKEMAL